MCSSKRDICRFVYMINLIRVIKSLFVFKTKFVYLQKVGSGKRQRIGLGARLFLYLFPANLGKY